MKKQPFNPIIHYLMISSLLIIFLTLMTSWFLWFFYCRDIIEIILVNFTFRNFSIVILTFSGLALDFALMLLFNPKKNIYNIYNNLFSLLSFVLSLVIVAISLFFYFNFRTDNFLVIFLPWIITITATGFLFMTSSINLIFNDKKNSKNQKIEPATSDVETETNIGEDKNLQTKKIQQSTLCSKKWNNQNFNISAFSIEDNNEITKSFIKVKNNNQANLTYTTNWTTKQIKQIWETAEIIPEVDKDLYRKDYAGAWMFFSAFIDLSNDTINNFRSYSWTIVTHKPLSQNGTDNIENLRAMNIGNALSKGENYPKWKTKISSYGNENILKEQLWNE